MKIFFDEENHLYYNADKVRFISCTQFLKKYQPPYPREHWLRVGSVKKILTGKAYKELKDAWLNDGGSLLDEYYPAFLEEEVRLNFPEEGQYYDEAYQLLEKQWTKKALTGQTRGTKAHQFKEKESLDDGVLYNPGTGTELPVIACGNESLTDHLSELQTDRGYTELIIDFPFPEPVWDPDLDMEIGGIAGQEDAVLIPSMVELLDYKSDEEIQMSPIKWKNYNTIEGKDYGFEEWAFPVNRAHSKYFKYIMQVSLYGWMMDQAGWTIKDENHILHIKKNTENIIPVPYERQLCSWMVSHYYWSLTGDHLTTVK